MGEAMQVMGQEVGQEEPMAVVVPVMVLQAMQLERGVKGVGIQTDTVVCASLFR